MTVIHETLDQEIFLRVQFVELLEMIGRIAEIKFANTEDAFLPLHERCMLVLEYILPLVNRQVN
jgi:hypothetical protein